MEVKKTFLEDMKMKPNKYLEIKSNVCSQSVTMTSNAKETSIGTKIMEAQYGSINVKRTREQLFVADSIGVEEILKKIAPPKSFLYRNNRINKLETPTSYVPMEAGTPKKSRRLFTLSSYGSNFDLKQFRFSKIESQISHNDRGYYSLDTTNKASPKTKSKSLIIPKEMNDKFSDEHLYEDLSHDGTEKSDGKASEINTPYKTKLHGLFKTIKLPFLKKTDDLEGKKMEISKVCNSDEHVYENGDVANIYDLVQIMHNDSHERECHPQTEDYLEPVQLEKHYCDVASDMTVHEEDYCDVATEKEDSLMTIIMNMIEKRFRNRRETSDATQNEDSTDYEFTKTPESPKKLEKAKENSKHTEKNKTNMADRPLPVPVENEPYYMDIDRNEAENLLRGTPDGTFVLRPSSQPNHAYTLTVSCGNAVHNLGVRRRSDGHLALGYARRGERSYPNVPALLRHHKKKRLLLVVGGSVCGATTLNDTPQYYQTPSNMPVASSTCQRC